MIAVFLHFFARKTLKIVPKLTKTFIYLLKVLQQSSTKRNKQNLSQINIKSQTCNKKRLIKNLFKHWSNHLHQIINRKWAKPSKYSKLIYNIAVTSKNPSNKWTNKSLYSKFKVNNWKFQIKIMKIKVKTE